MNSESNEEKVLYKSDIIKGIFLLILAISGNFIAEILSCPTQRLLTNNMYAKHTITLLILYFTTGFIQDKDTPLHPYDSFKICILTYLLFLLFTRMNIHFTIATFIIIALIYINYTFLNFYKKKESHKTYIIKLHEKINSILFTIMYILIAIGFILYFNKQYKDHKKNFSIFKYIFGIKKCSH